MSSRPLLSLPLRNAVGVDQRRGIFGPIGLPLDRALTVDFHRAEKNEALDARGGRLLCQSQGALGIGQAKCAKRIGLALSHDMHPGSAMNDRVHIGKRFPPVAIGAQVGGHADLMRRLVTRRVTKSTAQNMLAIGEYPRLQRTPHKTTGASQ